MLRSKNSNVKFVKNIKKNANSKISKKADLENHIQSIKRLSPPVDISLPAKRHALKDIINEVDVVTEEIIADPCFIKDEELLAQPLRRSKRLLNISPSMEITVDTPVTNVQTVLEATSLSDTSSKETSIEIEPPAAVASEWIDIDEADADDPFFSSEYAPDIYEYMRQREEEFIITSYLDHQPHINSSMRTILIDWLVEVQENFELFHETLYLAVKIVDRYLEKNEVKKEYLQLVGATAMLISAKFEELSPPLVDDFIYLCDDAYQHDELLTMERSILLALNYDINAPIAYRFLRRLARAANADMETHTLARYIAESTLQEYSFVSEKPSHIAAAAMYLAIRMKELGPWTMTLQHYSQCTAEQLLPLVERLNHLISQPPSATATVHSKYSHEVFYKVASISPLDDVHRDYEIMT